MSVLLQTHRETTAKTRWVVVVLLAQMAFALVTAAVQQTPTIDEPVYVGAAAVQLEQHSLRYNPEHPPLGKLIMGAGLAFARPELDPADAPDQTLLGQRLLYESGNDAWRLMLAARVPIIILTLLFGLVVFAFARDLTGPLGGLVALALFTFSPDLIAHGSLATLDVPVTGFLVTTAWLLWRARGRPVLYLPLAGLALGAAQATKMSALAALPVLLPLVVLAVWSATSGKAARRLAIGVAAAAGVLAIAVAVVWAAYLAVDLRLDPTTVERVPYVGPRRRLAVDLLPFPEAYKVGVRVQSGWEDRDVAGFLLGRKYLGSIWYYLPVALAIKTPLGMMALWAAGSATMLAVRRLRPAVPFVLIPAAALLVAAMASARNFGVRYALFLPMLLAVAAAAVVLWRSRWARAVAAGLVLFVAVSSAATYPYYLPYSNEAFGGPSQTARYLHDSNVDWGQDLGRLGHLLHDKYPGERVWLVYKGSGVPAYYGIDAHDPLRASPEDVHGLLVVSDSRIARANRRLLRLMEGAEKIDRVGHSITIFRRP
ncbi:MAG TPA: phospholipid carrier-dependent glycosyltransferase [Micromonosporaceae bacterium]|nr:phospholipid carrier-dependent glycosyltransferase [Micromonosporaceae bacterium]